jgi:hypothetical protein
MVAITRLVAGSIRETEPEFRFAVHTEPKAAMTPSGYVPTGIWATTVPMAEAPVPPVLAGPVVLAE